MEHRPSTDLLVVITMTTIAVLVLVLGIDQPFIRAVATLPLVIFLPGYALAAVVFVPGTIDAVHRLLVSLAFSIALTVLGGFVLNSTTIGLRTEAWLIWSVSIVLAALAVAQYRRRNRPLRESILPQFRVTPGQVFLMLIALVLVLGAIFLARESAQQPRQPGFTQLWVVPADKAEANKIQFGIYNMELKPMRYLLHVEVGGDVINQYEWSDIVLKPGEQWENVIDLPSPGTPRTSITAALYDMTHPDQVYRHVEIKGATSGKVTSP